MKKDSVFPFGCKVQYFLADIYYQGSPIAQRIKSKLTISDIKYVEPRLILYPPRDDYKKIIVHFEIEIKGYFEFIDGEKAGEVYIPKGYTIQGNSTSFATSWDECTIEIMPHECYLKYHLEPQEDTMKKDARISFSLSDNKIVQPWGIIEKSFEGTVKPNLKPSVILDFKNGWLATFRKHYRYLEKEIENVKGTFSASRLVLILERNEHHLESEEQVKEIVKPLDTLLWYLSFGSRQRTVWLDWTAIIGNEHIEYYRLQSIPPKMSDIGKALIDRGTAQEFLQQCLEYQKQKDSLNLYLPIVYLVSAADDDLSMEKRFLSLFMALEALLNLYAEKRELSRNFKNVEDWKAFYSYMEKVICEFPGLRNEDKIIMVRKLGMFNQVSTKVIYDHFCLEMKLDNSDLWSIYGNNRRCSYLHDIRNKLIHGKRFEDWGMLTRAIEHLRWTVERCLLAILNWREKTEVFHKESLQKYTAYRDWRDYYENKNHYK